MTLRYGLIGCGMMGQEHIQNVALLEGVEVTALADPNDEMRQAAQTLVGSDVGTYGDFNDMIEQESCDAYIIATPNDMHLEPLLRLLKYGKPILVEKPLCTTLNDCRQALKAAEESGVPVWVAMEYRFMPPLAELIRCVTNGDVGQPIMMSFREHRFPFLNKVKNWNRFSQRTGGTLVEKCCHFWDLMRLVLNSNPLRVFASGSIDVNHLSEQYDGQMPDILDNAYVIVDFENGARGLVDLCMFAEGSYWQETASVTGASARIDAMIPPPESFLPDGEKRVPLVEISHREDREIFRYETPVDPEILHAGDHCGSTFYQHVNFLDLVKGDLAKPLVNLSDGSWAVAIGEAAETSVKTGQSVAIVPP